MKPEARYLYSTQINFIVTNIILFILYSILNYRLVNTLFPNEY